MKSLEEKMKEPGGVAMVNFWMGFILASIIGGVIIFFMVRHAENERTARLLDNGRNQAKIAAGQALAKSYADRANELEGRLIKERDSAKVAQSALKIENQGYKKAISRLRPLVAARIDSVPDLRDFVALQDSTIQNQDSLITSLEFSCMAQVRDFEEIIRLNRFQIQEQVGISNSLQEMILDEQGKTRKAERGKRFWKRVSGFVVVTAATVVTIITLKE